MIKGLTIIGESINDSVPSTQALYDAADLKGIVQLARLQAEAGATYIDVNIGLRPASLMTEVIERIQTLMTTKISIDSPSFEVLKAGLETVRSKPILNSISPQRKEMFELAKIRSFRPILLISENNNAPCTTVDETLEAARVLLEAAHQVGIPNEDCIFDPGIGPIAADMDGSIKRVFGSMKRISEDPLFAGVHFSVGMSNFTVMLPPKRADGGPVKSALESAFITRASKVGLDFIIGSVKRNYRILPEGDPALVCLDDCLSIPDDQVVERVMEFYS